MQSVVAGQAPTTLEWKNKYLGKKKNTARKDKSAGPAYAYTRKFTVH